MSNFSKTTHENHESLDAITSKFVQLVDKENSKHFENIMNEAVENEKTQSQLIDLLNECYESLNEINIFNLGTLKDIINSSLDDDRCDSKYFNPNIATILTDYYFADEETSFFELDEVYCTAKELSIPETFYNLIKYGDDNYETLSKLNNKLFEIVPELKKLINQPRHETTHEL